MNAEQARELSIESLSKAHIDEALLLVRGAANKGFFNCNLTGKLWGSNRERLNIARQQLVKIGYKITWNSLSDCWRIDWN